MLEILFVLGGLIVIGRLLRQGTVSASVPVASASAPTVAVSIPPYLASYIAPAPASDLSKAQNPTPASLYTVGGGLDLNSLADEAAMDMSTATQAIVSAVKGAQP